MSGVPSYLPEPIESRTLISRKKRKAFLESLARTGQIAASARAAGFRDTRYVRALYSRDEEFRRAWDDAIFAAGDMFEDEAARRAVTGVDEPVFYKGKIVGYNNRRSDQLLMFLLRGARPDKYSDKVDVQNTFKGTFGVAVLPMTAVSAAAWEAVAASHAASLPHQPTPEALPAPVQPPGETAPVTMVRGS